MRWAFAIWQPSVTSAKQVTVSAVSFAGARPFFCKECVLWLNLQCCAVTLYDRAGKHSVDQMQEARAARSRYARAFFTHHSQYRYLPYGSVRSRTHGRQTLVALRHLPYGLVELLSIESRSLLLGHSCRGVETSALLSWSQCLIQTKKQNNKKLTIQKRKLRVHNPPRLHERTPGKCTDARAEDRAQTPTLILEESLGGKAWDFFCGFRFSLSFFSFFFPVTGSPLTNTLDVTAQGQLSGLRSKPRESQNFCFIMIKEYQYNPGYPFVVKSCHINFFSL